MDFDSTPMKTVYNILHMLQLMHIMDRGNSLATVLHFHDNLTQIIAVIHSSANIFAHEKNLSYCIHYYYMYYSEYHCPLLSTCTYIHTLYYHNSMMA